MTDREPSTRMRPVFSVVVPTFNRPRPLANCLEALSRVGYPSRAFEVLVVDDGGSVSLESVVQPWRDLMRIRVISQDRGGPAVARNNGATHAKGEWLVFLDDDCTPLPGWLQAFANGIDRENEMLGGLTVNELTRNSYSIASQVVVDYVSECFLQSSSPLRFLTTNNLAVSAAQFRALGGFDTRFPRAAAEDREFCRRWVRSGGRLRRMPRAVVRHAHHLDFASFWRQHFHYGQGAFLFHAMEGRRAPPLTAQSASFYAGLFLAAFRANPRLRPWRVSMLLALSQLAHTAGFVSAAVSGRGRLTAGR